MEKYGVDKSSEMEKTAKKKEKKSADLLKQSWEEIKKKESFIGHLQHGPKSKK